MGERSVKSERRRCGGLHLAPGFRFHPLDEEVITDYLVEKMRNPSFDPEAMGEVNLNKVEPWDLPSEAKMGEEEWFFFCHKDMKYPTGSRTNRATKEGYWKATGRDRDIFGGRRRELVGMKKTLVFYLGRAPRGTKTNWVMHEFRLHGSSTDSGNLRFDPKDEWVVCKVFHKKGEQQNKAAAAAEEEEQQQSAGTPNVSSVVEAAAEGDDFVDSVMIDPMYDLDPAADNILAVHGSEAAPYMSDYSSIIASAAGPGGGFVLDPLPYNGYSFNDGRIVPSGNLRQAAMANPPAVRVPGSSGFSTSWGALRATAGGGHAAMGGSYDLRQQQQEMMLKHLGGLAAPTFAGGLPSSSAAAAGVLQQNYPLGAPPQIKPENYGDGRRRAAPYNPASSSDAAADKNLGAPGWEF